MASALERATVLVGLACVICVAHAGANPLNPDGLAAMSETVNSRRAFG